MLTFLLALYTVLLKPFHNYSKMFFGAVCLVQSQCPIQRPIRDYPLHVVLRTHLCGRMSQFRLLSCFLMVSFMLVTWTINTMLMIICPQRITSSPPDIGADELDCLGSICLDSPLQR